MKKGLSIFALTVITIFILFGCQKEKAHQINKKKSVSSLNKEQSVRGTQTKEGENIMPESQEELSPNDVTIDPEHPRSGDTIVVRTGIKARKYILYVNDQKYKEDTRPVFKLENVKKGDEIYVEVVGSKATLKSDKFTVENSPPRITYAELIPQSPTVQDTISVKAIAQDRDGDKTRILYKWSINGVVVDEGENLTTFKEGYKRGDIVSVKIIPYDEETEGISVVKEVEIANALPRVTSRIKGIDKKTGMLVIEVKANDPDGDALTYSLQDAPEGMNIDSKTGLIRWKVPEDTSGTVPVQVEVDDGNGGRTLYSFEVTITRK